MACETEGIGKILWKLFMFEIGTHIPAHTPPVPPGTECSMPITPTPGIEHSMPITPTPGTECSMVTTKGTIVGHGAGTSSVHTASNLAIHSTTILLLQKPCLQLTKHLQQVKHLIQLLQKLQPLECCMDV